MRLAASRALIRCGGGRCGQGDLESLGEEPPERNYRLTVVIGCRFESTPRIGQVRVHALARYIHDIDDVLTRPRTLNGGVRGQLSAWLSVPLVRSHCLR